MPLPFDAITIGAIAIEDTPSDELLTADFVTVAFGWSLMMPLPFYAVAIDATASNTF